MLLLCRIEYCHNAKIILFQNHWKTVGNLGCQFLKIWNFYIVKYKYPFGKKRNTILCLKIVYIVSETCL